MEECESLYSEMTEFQEFQCEASDVMSQDDEDEVEELQNRCFKKKKCAEEPQLCLVLSLFRVAF